VVQLEDLVDQAILLIHPVGSVEDKEVAHKLGLVEDKEVAHKVDLVEEMLEAKEMMANQAPWRKQSLEYQAMIIQYLQKFQKHHFFVMDKLMVGTMLIPKLNAKLSIFVQMMEMVV